MPNKSLETHFFTFVLNGMPFVTYHIETFKKLNRPWKWHIVEGVSDYKHDSAWPLEFGGRITDHMHKNGISNDGTSEYIDKLAQLYPENIYIYRKPKGEFWDGRVEMLNAPLRNIQKECVLWEIDVDEFWSTVQIETTIKMFAEHPGKTAAWFYSHFFVGPRLAITTYNNYGNFPFVRVWRYNPGMVWTAQEPPTLILRTRFGTYDMGHLNPFSCKETKNLNLFFEHYAYVLHKQVLFKEIYYGYHDGLKQWKRLQKWNNFPTYLRYFFWWVKDQAVVDILEPTILDADILEKQNKSGELVK